LFPGAHMRGVGSKWCRQRWPRRQVKTRPQCMALRLCRNYCQLMQWLYERVNHFCIKFRTNFFPKLGSLEILLPIGVSIVAPSSPSIGSHYSVPRNLHSKFFATAVVYLYRVRGYRTGNPSSKNQQARN
jgi:hypothetical protein